jgi:DNA-binding NtrC family response regulator
MGIGVKKIRSTAMQLLKSHRWEGNIRELENLVRYLLVVTDGEYIEPQDLPGNFNPSDEAHAIPLKPTTLANSSTNALENTNAEEASLFGDKSWEQVERSYALFLLKKNNWNISWASRDAGVNRSTFASRMKRLGIKK